MCSKKWYTEREENFYYGIHMNCHKFVHYTLLTTRYSIILSPATVILHFYNYSNIVQGNIDIADALYSGHLNVGDTFFKNGQNYSQILLMKPVYGGQFVVNTSI